MTSCHGLENREEVGSSPGDRESAPQHTALLLSLTEVGKAQPRLGFHSPEMPQGSCCVPQPRHSPQQVSMAGDRDKGNSAGDGISLFP